MPTFANLLKIKTEDVEANGSVKYYESEERCAEFSKTCVENRLRFNSCEVKSIEVAPFGAGGLQTITIKGQGFGKSLLGSIEIPNAYQGGKTNIDVKAFSDYITYWQDDEIQLLISSIFEGDKTNVMGTGNWKIYPNFISSPDYCTVLVDIDYALTNMVGVDNKDKMINLGQNPLFVPDGAIEWYIDDTIDANPILQANGITFAMVETVAQAAFCDWEIVSGIEFRYMGPIKDANYVKDDQKNVLFFGTLSNPSIAAETRVRYSPNLCLNTPYFQGRFTEFDTNINIESNWFVSIGTNIGIGQYDLYSVLLHEIGHGILLQHAMDTDPNNDVLDSRVMFWALKDKQIKRKIDNKTIKGIQLLKDRTVQSINDPANCFHDYKLNTTPTGCITPTKEIEKQYCQTFINTLNAIGSDIRLTSKEATIQDIQLFNSFGQLLFLHRNKEGLADFAIPTTGYSAGIYFLKYTCSGANQVGKIILH